MEIQRGVAEPQLSIVVDNVAKRMESVERASRELCSTQEPTDEIHEVQMVKRVYGGVSPLQEPTRRTSPDESSKEVANLNIALVDKI